MAALFAIASHRAVTKPVTKKPILVEMPVNAPGSVACRFTHLVASVPCLVRTHIEPPEEGKPDGLEVGAPGVQYLPADAPVMVIGAHAHISVRALASDGVFCAAPMSSM